MGFDFDFSTDFPETNDALTSGSGSLFFLCYFERPKTFSVYFFSFFLNFSISRFVSQACGLILFPMFQDQPAIG